jgi:hypothetical protein
MTVVRKNIDGEEKWLTVQYDLLIIAHQVCTYGENTMYDVEAMFEEFFAASGYHEDLKEFCREVFEEAWQKGFECGNGSNY